MTGVSRNSVANYVKSYIELDSSLDEVLQLSDAELAQLFISKRPIKAKKVLDIIHPDWNEVHYEERLAKRYNRNTSLVCFIVILPSRGTPSSSVTPL